MQSSRVRSLVAMLCVSFVAAACGSAPAAKPQAKAPAAAKTAAATPAAAAKPAAKPLRHATLLLAYIIEGYHAPFFLALERGYYRQAGIDLKIVPGHGSANTAQQVAAGHATFGNVDAGTAALSIAKGLPIRMVDVLFQKSPMATVYDAPTHLASPAGLKGLTVAEPPGSGTATIWPILLKLNHVAPSSIRVVGLASNGLNTALLDHKIQAFNTFFITAVPQLEAQGAKGVGALHWADWGIHQMNLGQVVNVQTIKKHPKLVAAFVHATLRGWAAAAKDPAAAAAALLKYYPKLNPKVVDVSAQQEMSLIRSPETKGHPLGWQSATLWKQTLAILKQTGRLKKNIPLSRIYTNRFVTGS